MLTFVVTYWTGSEERVSAESIEHAYDGIWHRPEGGSHLWKLDDGTAEVTNDQGDQCATIRLEA